MLCGESLVQDTISKWLGSPLCLPGCNVTLRILPLIYFKFISQQTAQMFRVLVLPSPPRSLPPAPAVSRCGSWGRAGLEFPAGCHMEHPSVQQLPCFIQQVVINNEIGLLEKPEVSVGWRVIDVPEAARAGSCQMAFKASAWCHQSCPCAVPSCQGPPKCLWM